MLGSGETDWSSVDVPRFLAWGAAATLAIDVLIYPLEAIKTKMQVEARARATLWRAFVETTARTMRGQGVRGFYRGFTLYTLGGLPSQGCVLRLRHPHARLAATSPASHIAEPTSSATASQRTR